MSDNVRTGAFTRTYSFGSGGRDPVQPRFHIEPVQDDGASAREGRPIFRNEERVQFIMPGSPNQPVFRITDEHKQRWPEHYAAFRRGEDMAVEGTPLEQWPPLSRAMVLELKALGFHSVEQLSQMPDTAVQKVGRGGYALRERAKAYLDEAEASAFSERLARENEAKSAEIAALQRQVAEQGELLERLSRQMIAQQDQPHPLATFVQGQHDPIEAARMAQAQEPPAASALDGLTRRGPGRPRKDAVAA